MLHKYQNNELLLLKFSQWKDFSTSRVADFTRFDVRWRLRVSGETEDDLPLKISLMMGQSFQDLTRLRSSAQVRERKRGVGVKLKRRAKLAGNLGTELYPQPFLHPTITARWDTNSLCCCSCFWIPIWRKLQKLSVCLFVCFGCLISGLNTTIFRDVIDV